MRELNSIAKNFLCLFAVLNISPSKRLCGIETHLMKRAKSNHEIL